MKSLFLLLSLTWFGTAFSQNQFHFLLTNNSTIHLTDPICKDMAEKSREQLISQIDELNKNQKKEGFKIEKQGLQQQAYFEMIQRFKSDPDHIFPVFPLTRLLFQSYRESYDLFFSAQKVTLKSLIEAGVEVSIKNVQVSSSETALDIEIKNILNPSIPSQTNHFSCPTGRMLLNDFDEEDLPWLNFWSEFYEEVKAKDWFEEAIMKVEPSLVSKTLLDKQADEKINALGLNNKELLIKGTEKVKRILKEVPYNIPFDEIVALLVSQDEQKISLLTYHKYPTELYFESEDELTSTNKEMTKWNFEKKKDQWDFYFRDSYQDSMDHIRSFYLSGFDSENRFKEETWIERNNLENITEDFRHMVFVRETSSPETENLVRNVIQPKLTSLFAEKGSQYNNFYQRISPQISDSWMQPDEQIYFQDVLISNPEKTAFIFPVLLTATDVDSEEYYSSEEFFKFYVLLKNADGSYKLYDWYYFKPFPFWSNHALLRCAESHLRNISNYTSDQTVINDAAFWDNYLLKKSGLGYAYLTEVVLSNESVSISKSEFDATVQDCIDLLLEHDLVDLYDHQLKQIIRCVNTIQKGNLTGTQNMKLISLSQELHFTKRLNKIQKNDGNYYLGLDVEFGAPMKEHSYYQIR